MSDSPANLTTKKSIAEKLRLPAMVFYEYRIDNGALYREAADELDRLTAEVAELKRHLREYCNPTNSADFDRANLYIRAALGEQP